MLDFDLESLVIGGDPSQEVKAPPIKSDSGSKDCVNLSSSTAVFRLKYVSAHKVEVNADLPKKTDKSSQ